MGPGHRTRGTSGGEYALMMGLVAVLALVALTALGGPAVYSAADLSKPAAIGELTGTALDAFGRIDVLVNNADIQHVSPIESFPPDKWDAVLAVEALATLWRKNTGTDEPRWLKPTMLFAEYLHDGFKHLGIEANPMAAFERWAQLSGKRP